METVDVILALEASEDVRAWKRAAAKRLKVPVSRIVDVRVVKHSIDARKRPVRVQIRLEVGLGEPLPPAIEPTWRASVLSSKAPTVVIVGCGPAGLFAALRCLELGMKPVVLERGKDASARRFDLAPILRKGTVVEDSNYCFGEGGAGTFSDGKLYTRATKRGPVRRVYEILVAHGAPARILVDAHPHIGSNLLPNVVMAMRRSILEFGGEVHFQERVSGLLRDGRGRVTGVSSANGREFLGKAVILATGHSARDIYRLLAVEEVRMERKPFAVGVRIEHPQPFIDQCQYHLRKGEKRPELLPAARYGLATKIEDRGVHSFCMCPGGWIVPAATENDEVVVNGMSLSRRDSPFANSGLVVTVEPEDVLSFEKEHGILAGIAYQKALEVAAKEAGGGGQVAPGQRVVDFLRGRVSDDLPEMSYFPGSRPAPLHEILPAGVAHRMQDGLRLFDRRIRGYAGKDALLLGFETRTSSPLRIPRDKECLEHPDLQGLFPCGEGAGFAGGIVSAALDGMRVAEAAGRSA
ncbi:MAG: NAD(P)/FAD-dependent oxidoreductase [Verrucomicrobiales bacterium]